MKIWKITSTHNSFEVFESSTKAYNSTAVCTDTKQIYIHGHWPVNQPEHDKKCIELIHNQGGVLVSPYKNQGAHGNINWALTQLPIDEGDFILTYDSDSHPETHGWDQAMSLALNSNPKLAAVHLMHNALINGRTWSNYMTDPVRVVVPNAIDMYNVTMWKASFLKHTDGLLGNGLYGSVEMRMRDVKDRLGYDFGYLYDYRENLCPIPINEQYQAWKSAHLRGDKRNFNEYVKGI